METEISDKSHVFEPGNKVHYVARHLRHEKVGSWNTENGIVKSVTKAGVFVVYHCGDRWDDIDNYTAACTNPEDLRHGWL